MALSMHMHSSLSSAPLGVSHMRPQALTTCNWMDLLRCVKSMKHAVQCAKYSSADPQLTLLVLQATPIDAKLPSPAELLYQCQIRITIPARIHNTGPAALPINEWIDAHSDASKSQADKQCKTLAPLYAGQPVVIYDTLCKIRNPATVVHVLPKDSYQVCTSNGVVYCCTRWHLCECSVKPHWHYLRCHNSHTTGSCQTSHFCTTTCTPKPVQLPQPPSIVPAMSATPKPQTPAFPEVAPAPVSVCSTQHSPCAAP